jgi:hypothetical protein
MDEFICSRSNCGDLKRTLESRLYPSIQINYHNYNTNSRRSILDPAVQQAKEDHLFFEDNTSCKENSDMPIPTQPCELAKESSVKGRTELSGEFTRWPHHTASHYEGSIEGEFPPAVNYATKPKFWM